jgi:hypothetical protein
MAYGRVREDTLNNEAPTDEAPTNEIVPVVPNAVLSPKVETDAIVQSTPEQGFYVPKSITSTFTVWLNPVSTLTSVLRPLERASAALYFVNNFKHNLETRYPTLKAHIDRMFQLTIFVAAVLAIWRSGLAWKLLRAFDHTVEGLGMYLTTLLPRLKALD